MISFHHPCGASRSPSPRPKAGPPSAGGGASGPFPNPSSDSFPFFRALASLPTALFIALGLVLLLPWAALAESRWERVEDRDFFFKTFETSDGSLIFHTGLGALHYQDPASGELLDIDPTLVEGEGWRNDTNALPVRLPTVLGDGEFLQLGPDIEGNPGVRWRPGPLVARLISGTEVTVGQAAPAIGALDDNLPNSVLYPDLYPGIDLRAEVRLGALDLFLVVREWILPFEPEQVDGVFVEAEIDTASELLGAIDERVAEGDSVEELPLYFGRGGEDPHVVDMMYDPGFSEPQLEEYSSALWGDEEGRAGPAPAGWSSSFSQWAASGHLRFFAELSSRIPDPEGDDYGVTSSALLATFKFRAADRVRGTFRFRVTRDNGVARGMHSVESTVADFSRATWHNGRLMAGRGDGRFWRGLAHFDYSNIVLNMKQLGGQWSIQSAAIGAPDTRNFSIANDVVAKDFAPLITSHAERFREPAPGFPGVDRIFPPAFSNALSRTYSAYSWSVPGGPINTGTWNSDAYTSTTVSVGGEDFHLAELINTAPGSQLPRAVWELSYRISKGIGSMLAFLALPNDATSCQACTDAHSDPAIQALNGDFRVGMGFSDIRLEVRASAQPQLQASLSAASVGGHNDQLYPGETLSWDLELSQLSGAGPVELTARDWAPSMGIDLWFTDPANPSTVVQAPSLANVGDKVRLNAKWRRAASSLYGQQRPLAVQVAFAGAHRQPGDLLEIPVTFKAPEGSFTINPIYPVVDDNISAPMGLAWLDLASSGYRGAAFGEAQVRAKSGPTSNLVRGTHWDLWNSATPSSDGELVIYPDQFAPGLYTVDIVPCLKPDGMPAAVHCQSAQPLSFEVRATGAPSPSIDFVSPWSLTDPTGGSVTLSVFGSNLGGSASGTTVSVPQVVTGASPASGSTATQVNVPVSLTGGTFCGPRTLTLTTTAGSATALVNITKPFAGSPNHFVVEAEAARLSGTKIQTQSNASGGQVVLIDTKGAAGEMNVTFRVPATSSNYQLYGLYGTTELNATRFDLEITEGANSIASYRVALPKVNAGDLSLRAFSDSTQSAPPTLLTLEAGKTYNLRLASRAVQRYPILDLLIFSDGSQPPTLAELCR
ncbi:MAG: hypothetical protein AAGD01_16325 [Acidobacteriota bacterium]